MGLARSDILYRSVGHGRWDDGWLEPAEMISENNPITRPTPKKQKKMQLLNQKQGMVVGLCGILLGLTACDENNTGATDGREHGRPSTSARTVERRGKITTMAEEACSFIIFTVIPAEGSSTNAGVGTTSAKLKDETYYLAFERNCVFVPEMLGEVLELGLSYRVKGQVVTEARRVSKLIGTEWRAGATENALELSEIELLAKASESRLLSNKEAGVLMMAGGSDWTYLHGPKGEKTMGYGMSEGVIRWREKPDGR